MPDITMCPGTGCKLRESCYRYMAEPSEYRQSFADFTKYIISDGKCEYFLVLIKPDAKQE